MFTFQLTVLLLVISLTDAELVCSTTCVRDETAENDPITYKCTILHSGVARHVLTWRNKQDGKEPQGVQEQKNEGSVISRAVITKAIAPSLTQLICADRALNILCESTLCDILYSVRNVVTWPILYASPGEQITCKADGNPAPNFEWQMLQDGQAKWEDIPGSNSEAIDAPLDNGTSIQLRCVAKNSVKGEEYRKASDAVTVSKSGAIIRTAVIVSSVVGLVILLIILVIIHKKYPKVFKIFDVLDLCKEEGEGSGE